MPITNVVDDVAIALTLCVLVVLLAPAVYVVATGRSVLPAVIERHLPRTPATTRDRRLQGAVLGIAAVGLLVDSAIFLLSEPGGPGHAAGPLYTPAFPGVLAGDAAMLIGLVASGIIQLQVRFLDRKSGVVLSELERIRNYMNPRRAWQFTADGQQWWDGGRWLSTLSPDGAYRWNGSFWSPVIGGPAQMAGPVRRLPTHRVATPLTRRMRYIVASWWAVQAAVVASMPFWYISTMSQWADAMNRQNLQFNSGPPPPDLSNINSEMTIAFYVSLLIAFAIAGTAAVGALKGWIWAFYAIVAALGLEAFNLSSSLFFNVALGVAFGQSSIGPAWMIWADAVVALPSAALAVWMVVVLRNTGPWAMKKLVVGAATG